METVKQRVPLHQDLAHESEVLMKLWQQGLLTLQALQTPLDVTASGQNDQGLHSAAITLDTLAAY